MGILLYYCCCTRCRCSSTTTTTVGDSALPETKAGQTMEERHATYTAAMNECSYSLCRQRDTGSANLLQQGEIHFAHHHHAVFFLIWLLCRASQSHISRILASKTTAVLCCYCCCSYRAAVGVRCSEPRGRRREREATRATKARGT